MSPSGTWVNLLLILVLVALTSFFVVTEYSLRGLRPGRVNSLVRENRRSAVPLARLMQRPQQALSACQLGVTMTSLFLGWLAQPLAKAWLHPLFRFFTLPNRLESILAFI
ncbi:DUF21 domain-containing protein, partial [Clostridium perfringens]